MSEFPQHLINDLLDDLDVAVFFTDADRIVRYLNEPAAALVRLPRLTATGRRIDRLLPGDIASFLETEGKEALATGQTRRIPRKSLILPGRGLLFFDIRTVPYRRREDGPWVANLLMDITARERRKIASDRARESAVAEARARRTFLARMSHEIRTPMNGIIGMTDLARSAESRDEIDEYLGVIKNASDSLLSIINDVLDFAKIESGRLETERIPLNPSAILDDILALLNPAAEEKGISLTGKVDESLPAALIGDPVRIRQIITNLLGNALKFTDHGSVSVELSGEPVSDSETGEMILRGVVKDTGIGIPANRLEELFEPFTQSDATTTREYGGTGLGLAICRTLARLMGGEVEAESKIGSGSTFRFHIRVQSMTGSEDEIPTEDTRRQSEKPAGEKLSLVWNGETVLLAEDNRVNRLVAEKLLRRVGLNPIVCENGKEAVEACRRARPDLILMDLQMPIMDGNEASRQIRAEHGEGLPIIALTAHVLEDERQEAKESGMDGWISKPVKPEELYAELARLLPPVISPV